LIGFIHQEQLSKNVVCLKQYPGGRCAEQLVAAGHSPGKGADYTGKYWKKSGDF